MSLRDEYLSDAKPGECLNMVETDMNHIQGGQIGALVRRRYMKADGSTYNVDQFTPRGPVVPAAVVAPEAAEKAAPKAKKPGLKSKIKKAFGLD